MKKDELYQNVITYFQKNIPQAQTELHYKNSFELLIAVILSAQCTDKRVNEVTLPLFQKYPNAEDMAKATPSDILKYIHSISYPNSKAKHLVGTAKALVEKFNGTVPSTSEELTQLPGVGRKTANVIQSVVFNKAVMAVDTHVFRVSNRIGLTNNSKTPLETEKELTKYIPEKLIPIAHHWLLLHGRYTCTAKNPKCDMCGLQSICKYYATYRK